MDGEPDPALAAANELLALIGDDDEAGPVQLFVGSGVLAALPKPKVAKSVFKSCQIQIVQSDGN